MPAEWIMLWSTNLFLRVYALCNPTYSTSGTFQSSTEAAIKFILTPLTSEFSLEQNEALERFMLHL